MQQKWVLLRLRHPGALPQLRPGAPNGIRVGHPAARDCEMCPGRLDCRQRDHEGATIAGELGLSMQP